MDELWKLNEWVSELAAPFWLKDAQKEGEFFDAGGFARALLSASKPAATQGWKLVPTELTEAMFRAWHDTITGQGAGGMNYHAPRYRAMLAASPAAPAQSAEPVAFGWVQDNPESPDKPHFVLNPNGPGMTNDRIEVYTTPQAAPSAVVLDDERAAIRQAAFKEAASVDAHVIAMLTTTGKVTRDDVDEALTKVAALSPAHTLAVSSQTMAIDVESIQQEFYKRGFNEGRAIGAEEARVAQPVEQTRALTDTARLDWLDAKNKPFKMGWRAAIAPVGNVSVGCIVQLGDKVTSIREAIDAAMTAAQPASGGEQ
jgi:hypothetical protein